MTGIDIDTWCEVYKEHVPRWKIIREHNENYHWFQEMGGSFGVIHIPADDEAVVP